MSDLRIRLQRVQESFAREMQALVQQRDAAAARSSTAERRLQRLIQRHDELRHALGAEAELRESLLRHLAELEQQHAGLIATRAGAGDLHDAAVAEVQRSARSHSDQTFALRSVVARLEQQLVHAHADVAELTEQIAELRQLAALRAERVAELERLQMPPPVAPSPRSPKASHSHSPSSSSSSASTSRHHRSRTHRPSTHRSNKSSAIERFGPPPALPHDAGPPPVPRLADAPPPLPSESGLVASLRQEVAEQRDQIRLLESSLARRDAEREKLSALERQVEQLARQVQVERELRDELQTLPRIDPAAIAAAGAQGDSLAAPPRAIRDNELLSRLARNVARNTMAVVETPPIGNDDDDGDDDVAIASSVDLWRTQSAGTQLLDELLRDCGE